MLNLVPSCHEKHSVGVEPFASWPSERDDGGALLPGFALCVPRACATSMYVMFFFHQK